MSSNALTPKKDSTVGYLLWMGGLLGFCGLHRIYMGRWISGLIWFATGGLCLVGQFVDLFMMRRMLSDSEKGVGW